MPGVDLREHSREVFPIIQRRLHIPGPKDLRGGQDESGLRGRGDTRHMQSRSGPRTSLWQLPSTCFCHLSTVPGSVPSPARHMHPVPT